MALKLWFKSDESNLNSAFSLLGVLVSFSVIHRSLLDSFLLLMIRLKDMARGCVLVVSLGGGSLRCTHHRPIDSITH